MNTNGFVEMNDFELQETEGGSVALLGLVVLCVAGFVVGCSETVSE